MFKTLLVNIDPIWMLKMRMKYAVKRKKEEAVHCKVI